MDFIKVHRGAVLATTAAAITIPFAIQDYLTYLSYGPGGTPYNVFGWLVTNFLRIISREQFSTAPYQDTRLYLQDQPGFLVDYLPQRQGPSRPIIGPHPVPQRQLSQVPDVEMRQKLVSRFDAVGQAAQSKGLVEVKQSLLERHHDALFVSKVLPWHPVTVQTRGEIAHIHAGKDGSNHFVLHPKDCAEVIEKGWGQRHAFSGADILKRVLGFSLPVNYVLVYAPRDDAEVEVALMILRASIRYMTASQESLEDLS